MNIAVRKRSSRSSVVAPTPAVITSTAAAAPISPSKRLLALAFVVAVFTPSVVTLPFEAPKVTAMRGLLIVTFFPALNTFFALLNRGERRIRGSDIFAVLACTSLFTAVSVTEGLPVALVSGNLYIVEFLGGYIFMRAYFGRVEEIDVLLRYLRWATFIVIGIALVDQWHGGHWFRNSVAQVFGQVQLPAAFRGGFLRAQASFDHPILYGTFCAFAGVLFFYGETKLWRGLLWLAICGFGCFLAQSSAPLLAYMLGALLIAYDRVLVAYPWRWKALLTTIGTLVIAIMIASENPMSFLIRHLTFDPQTGFYRLNIWEWGGAEVLNSPLVGIGYRDWIRPSWMGSASVDSMWLGLAMTYGIPMSCLTAGAVFASMRGPAGNVPMNHRTRVGRGLSVVLSLAIFVCFTVAFWGVMWTLLAALTALRTNLGGRPPGAIVRPSRSRPALLARASVRSRSSIAGRDPPTGRDALCADRDLTRNARSHSPRDGVVRAWGRGRERPRVTDLSNLNDC